MSIIRGGEFTKQPDEKFPISIDFAEDLTASETISSATITAYDSDDDDVSSTIISGSYSISDGDQTDSKVIQTIKSGTDGETYKITFLVTTSSGNNYEGDVFMNVKAT